MPIACLRIPCFALRIALLESPQLDGHPLVLSNPQSGRAIVLDTTPEAHDHGVRAGMTLREASALCPAAIILAADPVRETAASTTIQTRLDQVSPLVEVDASEPGCWYIDLTGLARYYGSFEQVTRQVIACADPILSPRVGIAPGKFAARVAAGTAAVGTTRTIAASDVATFLATAPVAWLPLPPEVTRQLDRLGIPTLGDFTRLPARKVAARFGPAGRQAWELARGNDDRPVVPQPRVQIVIEHLELEAPLTSREMLMVGLRQIVTRAFGTPDLRGRHVREVVMRAVLEGDRRSWERTLTLKEPSGRSRVLSALELRLQTLEMEGPIEAITLEFRGITTETARQTVFPTMGTRATAPLTHAVQQLTHRYGLSPIYHVVEVEPWSRIPERRHALITYEP